MNRNILEQPAFTLFRQAYAERKAPLVLICGSGLSASAKLPTWLGLRDNLVAEADKKFRAQGQIGQEMLATDLAALKQQKDLWVTFKLIKKFLGKPLFESLVERDLTPPDDAKVPGSYLELLRLNVAGMVTLNLDKFAGEALSQTQSVPITPIYGTEIARKWTQIRAAKTFLVYLHGGLHDPSTWIMTQDDLTAIGQGDGYSLFLKSIFVDNLVLFAGINPDDVALSEKLIQLKDSGFIPRNLYWITTRNGTADNWASEAGVKIISYQATNDGEHASTIRTVVDDLLKYRPVERPEPPLIKQESESAVPADEIDPEELAQLPPEEIRERIAILLNNRLLVAEQSGVDDVFKEYRRFCEEYDFAVDRAFYHGKIEKFRTWFGYKLDVASLGRGNFGEVYSAQSPEGKLVAVKIMNRNIFGNNDMLAGFRRGVRSMEIVTQNQVEGMIPIIESFELPPTIIMPYVAGLSLEDAIQSEVSMPWLTKLDIAIAIGRIVNRGHALPQTVLHRDLKPSNIMISNMEYDGSFEPEVVVLDFDMSWHKGSKEKDIVFESRDDFGYLAPEQTDKNNNFSARSTRVDSYGFGMTLFFLFGGEAPRPNEALSDLWVGRATRSVSHGYAHGWKSGPFRLGRLISRATVIEQSLRVDFATMMHELEFIRQAIRAPNTLDNPELWAEEIMADVVGDADYEWDDAIGKGLVIKPTGIKMEVVTNFRNGSVVFATGLSDRGFSDRSKLSKYLGAAVDTACRSLRDGDWTILERSSGQREAFVKAEVTVATLQEDREKALLAAHQALKAFQI